MNKKRISIFLSTVFILGLFAGHLVSRGHAQTLLQNSITLEEIGRSNVCSANEPGQDWLSSYGAFNTFLPMLRNGSGFLEAFYGDPSAPTPWNSSAWDITVHSRDVTKFYTYNPMDAMHGPGCDPPPATHPISTYDAAVYNCKNHVMTAINDAGYGVIYLTPDQMVDFSGQEAIVRFNVSTFRTSYRDWIDVRITPYEDNLQLPLESWLPDLSGEPRRSVHVSLFGPENSFGASVVRNFNTQTLDSLFWIGYESFLEPSSTRRDLFELRISKNHLKFGMPEYEVWWVDTELDPPLDWSQGVLQLGHHSYNPTKDCDQTVPCTPNTWHWDNVFISPSARFTIIHANQRYVDATLSSNLVTFDSAAPANAHLRFAGIGSDLEISFNNGLSWEPAQLQATSEAFDSGGFASYWTPVPEGVSSVRFRGSSGWASIWHVRDLTIWAQK